MTTDKRANFGTKLGVILASAGSAVGLGNIWRFPYMTGEYGGAAFILTYLGCVLLFGAPIMMAEFIIGRRSRSNTARAYQKLAPGTHWRWVGRMGVLAGFRPSAPSPTRGRPTSCCSMNPSSATPGCPWCGPSSSCC